MYSQYWNTARGRKPDYRRYTVVEGETLISLGVNARRRLHSAPVEEVECGGRPNPEGAGSVSVTELSHYGEKGEGEGPLCQRCQIIATELNRQALALADPASLKDPGFAVFLFDKLQHLQCPHRGPYAREDSTCQVCGTALHQLRRLALQKALGLTGDMPDLHPGAFSSGLTPSPAAHSVVTLPCQDWSMEDSPAKQPPRFYDQIPGERFRGGLQGWGGIQSSYMGGSKSTVTPIPQHFLEGVWRVSRVRRDHHPHSAVTPGLAPDPYRNYMPIAPGSPIYDYATITPTVPQPQPTPTQTSHTPSAAASFFISIVHALLSLSPTHLERVHM
ncbi:kinesin-like protein KIF26A [Salvelinus sp. IW2-2015]|uniref:kinesin-like protein KIF26A n=1 Tax=Salvelinus sp. IW2-2015 TaxID=2691554 RepID=UPI000CDFCEDC|nr:kinesin-like protein KIF26A [Salvelinus alpinus]